MKTFTAQIIYRIECEGIAIDQYEEQWRLIYANDHREALQEARNVAQQEELTFIDRHGRAVQWKLVAVKDLQAVDLSNGTLLCSSVKEIEPVVEPLWSNELVTTK